MQKEQEYTNKEIYNIFINLADEVNFSDIWDDNLCEFILFVNDYLDEIQTTLIKHYYTSLTNKDFTSKTILYPTLAERMQIIYDLKYLCCFHRWSYKSRLDSMGLKKYKQILSNVYECFIDGVCVIDE